MARKAALAIILVLLSAVTGSRAYALERDDVSLHVSFEKGLAPDISQGKTRFKLSVGSVKDVAFDAAGVRGRGVKLDDKLSISYSGKIFSQKEGTISYWMKPSRVMLSALSFGG